MSTPDEFQEMYAQEFPAPVTLLSKMRNGRYLNDTTFPALRWIVPQVVPEGMSVLIGAPKIGKSWLGLAFTLAAASGGRALGQLEVGPARPVLHLALEDGHRRMQDRGRQLLAGDAFPPLFDYLLELEPGMIVATIAEWLMQPEVRLNPHPPFVLLDTLGKVMPDARPGESAYQRDYRIAGQLKRICDDVPGMGMLVLHHDRKAAADDFVDTVSGTNGIAGAADTIMALGRKRMETTGLLKVTGRDVDENEYAMTTEGGRWELAGTLAQAADVARSVRAAEGLADRSAEILAVVEQHPEGVTAKDVGAILPDLDQKQIGVYLYRLEKAGRVCKPTRGTYAPR